MISRKKKNGIDIYIAPELRLNMSCPASGSRHIASEYVKNREGPHIYGNKNLFN